MQLTVIGASGSVSSPDSASSCYLVQAGQTSVLLDLGSGAFGQVLRYLQPEHIDAVLLSHLHADHVVDLVGLDVYLRYGPGSPHRPIALWGPVGTSNRIEELCGEPGGGRDAFTVGQWQPGVTISVGPLQIEPFRVEHPVPAYALRITGPADQGEETRTLVYTGDTDACDGVRAAAVGADLLLAEAAFEDGRDLIRGIHLTGRRSGELASHAAVRRLVLTHIPPWTSPETVRAEACTTYGGPVDLARPGVTFTL
ncbi:MAG: MBL fold metallo-hydrolase [Beutenbergiaceae bacterium]